MQGSIFHFGFYFDGAMAADTVREFKAPFDMQLLKVGSQAGNTLTCILDIGTVADPDAYLDGVTITGATGVAELLGQSDFVDGQYPAIPADTQVQITIDFDGGSGGNVGDLNLDLWFTY